ncbi:MAG: type VI secretion system baseplate subunit TssG [Candidatus Thiothrix putei]|uniref:Type VI secretion system baseplate subunit TssG n=1 Tax=Candidatus Thiothrix putei TaxID=3080811 RepID=A0AA95HDR0_9GAMM|nr:MAG: type VI secretion system baseplate subunit TssG [Candidatus Thiothrix putei]
MADTDRNDPDFVDILTDLGRQANRYDFFAALRAVECHFRDKPRLGQSVNPAEDGIRLGQEPSNLFAPSALHSCQPQADGYWHLQVLFFGLFGPQGPLPQHLTEYVRERRRNEVRDEATLAFMNLFHHRLLSLLYRAWANKEPTVQRDRVENDDFDRYTGALLGIGIPELQHRDAMRV